MKHGIDKRLHSCSLRGCGLSQWLKEFLLFHSCQAVCWYQMENTTFIATRSFIQLLSIQLLTVLIQEQLSQHHCERQDTGILCAFCLLFKNIYRTSSIFSSFFSGSTAGTSNTSSVVGAEVKVHDIICILKCSYLLRYHLDISYVIKTEGQGKYPRDILLYFLPLGWLSQIVCACLSAPGGVRPTKKPLPAAIWGTAALPIPTIVWWEKAGLLKL